MKIFPFFEILARQIDDFQEKKVFWDDKNFWPPEHGNKIGQ